MDEDSTSGDLLTLREVSNIIYWPNAQIAVRGPGDTMVFRYDWNCGCNATETGAGVNLLFVNWCRTHAVKEQS